MAGTCIHGFATGTCLICQTLDIPSASAATKEAPAPRPPAPRPPAPRPSARHSAAVERTSPRVLPVDGPGPRSAAGLKMIGLGVGAIVVVVLAWTVFHLVFAVLHILELVAVAVVAGYVAWKAGVHHGRRTAAPPRTKTR